MSSARASSPPHSAPIPITTQSASHFHARARSASSSSSSDGGSPPTRSPVTPPSLTGTLPRISPVAGPGTSPSSPILSYFLGASSPSALKTSGSAFPFRGAFGQGVADEDDRDEPPVVRHARRASMSANMPPRFPPTPLTDAQQQRGVGVLRRLSLSTGFGRPQISPPSFATVPQAQSTDVPAPVRKAPSPCPPQRRATLGAPPPSTTRRRAPSPMGERILKGHFDGFN